jgi:hypothetical protein
MQDEFRTLRQSPFVTILSAHHFRGVLRRIAASSVRPPSSRFGGRGLSSEKINKRELFRGDKRLLDTG